MLTYLSRQPFGLTRPGLGFGSDILLGVFPMSLVKSAPPEGHEARMELANRLFFRLYQCANMLHKTGSRAVEEEGLTTQQWAVLGALSREQAKGGISVGELARYLMVSRQNLSGVISRMERNGVLAVVPDEQDRRSRVIRMSPEGQQLWTERALPKIRAYYERILVDFSINDLSHNLHYLLKMLDNMKQVDDEHGGDEPHAEDSAVVQPAAGETAGPTLPQGR